MLETVRSRLSAWVHDAAIRRLARNASWLFWAQVFTMLVSAVQFPMVARALGPENYGLWGLATSWVGMIGQMFGIRMWETVIKFLSQFVAGNDEARALAIVKLCVLVEATISVVVFAIINLTASVAAGIVYRSYPAGADLIRLEAFNGIMGLTMSIWMATLRVFDRFKQVSVYNMISSVALFILWVLVIRFDGGIGGLILASAVVRMGHTLALASMAQRELSRRFGRHWFTADLAALHDYRRDIWVLLFSMNFDTFRKIVNNSGDLLIIGWFATPQQVGLYRLAKQLAGYLNTMFGQFYEAMYPEIPRLYLAEGAQRVRAFIRRATLGLGAGMAVCVAAAYTIAPPLIPLVFGNEYASAITVFLILVWGGFWVLLFWAPSLLVTLGKAPQLMLINFAISAATLVALLAFTPLWSAYGAAFASVVNLIVALIIYMLYFARVPEFEWRRMFLKHNPVSGE